LISALKGDLLEDSAARNVRNWYSKEKEAHSYKARDFRVDPSRTALFREFRADPYYHLKNLVEIVTRTYYEAEYASRGINAKVYVTSDSDDVCAGVDFVVEATNPDGKNEYFGIDLAVSENDRYLSKKRKREFTKCREFNSFKGFPRRRKLDERGYPDHSDDGEWEMPRQVRSVPPTVMTGFLLSYMDAVVKGRPPTSQEALTLFAEAQERSVALTKIKTAGRVANVLH